MTYEKSNDEVISSLFQDAIVKLDKVEFQAKESKKQIIIDLAKELERKIPEDTVCIEIVNQLRGQTSERFIRECLDEIYKQKVRVDNAKKQKYQRIQEEADKVSGKLAAVTPLNQEDEEDNNENNKKVIIRDIDGRMSIQDDEGDEEQPQSATTTTIDMSSIRDKTFASISYLQQQEQEQLKEHDNNEFEESSTYKEEMYDENHIETEKSSQLITNPENEMGRRGI